ncbi:hypothetical protein BDK51DRAFT_39477, partial [Blyttiomyces helicus]
MDPPTASSQPLDDSTRPRSRSPQPERLQAPPTTTDDPTPSAPSPSDDPANPPPAEHSEGRERLIGDKKRRDDTDDEHCDGRAVKRLRTAPSPDPESEEEEEKGSGSRLNMRKRRFEEEEEEDGEVERAGTVEPEADSPSDVDSVAHNDNDEDDEDNQEDEDDDEDDGGGSPAPKPPPPLAINRRASIKFSESPRLAAPRLTPATATSAPTTKRPTLSSPSSSNSSTSSLSSTSKHKPKTKPAATKKGHGPSTLGPRTHHRRASTSSIGSSVSSSSSTSALSSTGTGSGSSASEADDDDERTPVPSPVGSPRLGSGSRARRGSEESAGSAASKKADAAGKTEDGDLKPQASTAGRSRGRRVPKEGDEEDEALDQLRREAHTTLIDIERDFAKFRAKMYDEKIAELESEIVAVNEGMPPLPFTCTSVQAGKRIIDGVPPGVHPVLVREIEEIERRKEQRVAAAAARKQNQQSSFESEYTAAVFQAECDYL